MSKNLEGRAAIVTGGGRGLGRGIALLFAQEGAKVVVNDPGLGREGQATEERPADEVVAEIRKAGGTAVANYGSVADYKQAAAMVEQCANEFGSVDLLVNTAGLLRERMIWNMTEEDFDLVISVHLKGHWNMCHHAIKRMRTQGFGRIVNVSSDAFKGAVGQCNYVAAKGGIISLSRAIAKEAAKYGITCNALCPVADTRMTLNEVVVANRKRRLDAGEITREQYDRIMKGRGPEFVAPVAAYLCTNEADWVNGQIIHIERWLLHTYKFGETLNPIEKDTDEGYFSLEELKEKIPAILKGTTQVAAPVRYQDAEKYINRR